MIIHGINVTLVNKVEDGVDGFNRPIYKDVEIEVANVLVGEPTAEEVTNSLNIYGKSVKYTLGIPKGDTNKWEGDVIIWGDRYRIIDGPTQGIEDMIPLEWNKKVHVEAYPGTNPEEA